MLAGARCTTQQRNTHSTESREVRYPWHPWFGRMITVYATLTKGGHPLCRCGLDDQHHERSLEVPTWMFEPVACERVRLADHASRDLPSQRREIPREASATAVAILADVPGQSRPTNYSPTTDGVWCTSR